MQRVARVVAAENAALREMLVSHGVAQSEIEAHLAASRTNEQGSSTRIDTAPSAVYTSRSTSRHLSPAATDSLSPSSQATSHGQPPTTLRMKEYSIELQTMLPQPLHQLQTRPECSPLSASQHPARRKPQPIANCNQTTFSSLDNRSASCPQPMIGQAKEVAVSKPLNKMHCMEAATILARLRAHPDTSLAQASLGCAENQDCMVRNTDLLQLMDEMT